jgi:oxalate---CoA ligase
LSIQNSGESLLGQAIRQRSELLPHQTAIIHSGCASFSYADLQFLIDEVRAGLLAAGFTSTSRIAVALPGGPHAALAMVAVTCSCVTVPLNPNYTFDETETCLAALRPDAIFLLQGSRSIARSAAERKGIPIIEVFPRSERDPGFGVAVPKQRSIAPVAEPSSNAIAFILQTSGTTAKPKLIPFSHRNMLAAAARLQSWFSLTSQDRCLCVNPVYYSHGLKVTVFTPLLTGGTLAFPSDASRFDYAEWFGALRPTWYSAGPTLHRSVFDQSKSTMNAKAGHSLRFILSGGAPLQKDVREGLQDTLGVPVIEHYGSSEAAQISANLPPPGRSKAGTCGTPWPETVAIVDENGNKLPPRRQGEILVCGPTLIAGYLDAPDLNRTSFVDGWFKTGDIGSIDEDGFLTLFGRRDDLINRGGEKIAPAEIDDALICHSAVAEAAAFSVPHPRLGEDVAAAVVLRPGKSASPAELRQYLSERLASFKVPRRIVIVDQLPKGATGKVLRRGLSLPSGGGDDATPETAIADPDGTALASQLTEIWERLLNYAPIGINDDFFEKGGDSLLAVELLSEVERLLGRTVPSSILFEAATIRQLSRKLTEGTDVQKEVLFRMPSGSSHSPLLFFHGAFNTGGTYVRKLGDLLGSDLPLIVIAPHGVDDDPIPRSLEAMAADRVPLIMKAQPRGPYRLAGYCLGSLVAFEAARLLIAAGETVELVALIDPPTGNARPSVKALLSMLARARPLIGPRADALMLRAWYGLVGADKSSNASVSKLWWAWLKDEALRAISFGRRQVFIAPEKHAPRVMAQSIDKNRQYAIAMSNYLPSPLAVRVIYFSSEYEAGAWGRISANLEEIRLPGDHGTVVSDPSDFAHLIKAVLKENCERPG